MKAPWHYINANNEVRGPIDSEALVELLRAKVINGSTLIWQEGMSDWEAAETRQEFRHLFRISPPPIPERKFVAAAPLVDDHSSLSPAVVADRKADSFEDKKAKSRLLHPWRRFFARYLDVMLFSVLFGVAVELSGAQWLSQATSNDYIFGMIALLMLVPFDGILIAIFGTTFGKALYSISIEKGQAPISFGESFSRAFAVYIRGMGLGLPIISLFTTYAAYKTLMETGATSWDREERLNVRHGSIGAVRLISLILVWAGFLSLIVWGIAQK